MTLLDRLNRLPPWLCRLLARTGTGRKSRPLTNTEIALRGGLNRSTVLEMSKLQRWDGVPVRTLVRYAAGCGVNVEAPQSEKEHLRTRAMIYMRNARGHQRKMFDRLLKMGETLKS